MNKSFTSSNPSLVSTFFILRDSRAIGNGSGAWPSQWLVHSGHLNMLVIQDLSEQLHIKRYLHPGNRTHLLELYIC